jgi:hypothetical protein
MPAIAGPSRLAGPAEQFYPPARAARAAHRETLAKHDRNTFWLLSDFPMLS